MNKTRRTKFIYVNANDPGFKRVKKGRGFCYQNIKGGIITNPKMIKRIESLAIPPAYKDVWICPSPRGNIQAYGYDDRGRKQYIYHSQWIAFRNENKYEHMLIFAKSLPKIRKRIAHDLALKGIPKNKLIATVIKLLDITHIRIGNLQYSEENDTYGLTTLRKKHISVRGERIWFDFQGKSNQKWHVEIHNKKLARILTQCESIPGYNLFKYYDEEGKIRELRSDHINAYLKQITKEDISAKDFRTWSGTVLFVERFINQATKSNNSNQQIKAVIKTIASQLGNSVAICKNCYIHPTILALANKANAIEIFKKTAKQVSKDRGKSLSDYENLTICLIK